MKTFLLRLRGALGTALLWALGWGATAAGLWTGAAMLLSLPFDDAFSNTLIAVAGTAGLTGAMAGMTFSSVLVALRRGRRLEDLKPGRMAFWGGLAGIGIPGVILAVASVLGGPMQLDVLGILLAGLGAAGAFTAGATVKIAQVAAAAGSDAGGAVTGGAAEKAVPAATASLGKAVGTGAASAAAPAAKPAPKTASQPAAAAPAPKSPPTPTAKPAPKPASKPPADDYDARLAAALEEDPEIAELLRDHRSDED